MFLKSSIRRLSSFVKPNEFTDLPNTMSAWQICGYSGLESLKLINTVEVPPLSRPNDVLVKVNAASVNALDVMMTEGYGHQVFEKFNKLKSSVFRQMANNQDLSLTYPGRDFAGVVQAVGGSVTGIKPGDEVMGVIQPPLPGSHAEYLVASACNMKHKPENLTMEEAASIPYAGLTAWSALSITAELCIGSKGKRVLVLGAAGGVGTIAIQLLKNWGTLVVSTGSSEAIPFLLQLGSDFAVDYTSPEADSELQQFGGFDVILDCSGRTEKFSYSLLKPWANAKYVTLSPPTLRNFDEHGMIGGLMKNGLDLLAANSTAIIEGKTLRWAYFIPSSAALTQLVDLARQKKLQPSIDSVFSYDQLPEAYAKMKGGHKHGKIIVQM
ncbi:reticulon-4-interacting protein 1, mitochondrial-like [Daphnia pulex]|uniref:reticulon-4-interacting protein 1, mitochondrial-like n=1 Tax=Daphnia pulex TaxID=6669 RepID=UPI001EDE4D3B|nr:reticulon-4-interacting protein 1, mitochondrial-like [Daphnia pulex]